MTDKDAGMRVAIVEPGREPYVTEIYPDKEGSYLSALQGLVGGLIEAFDPLFGDQPLLYVNEEGLLNGSVPNRAVYANKTMEQDGYLSQMDYRTVVREGDLYAILFGTFVAVGCDEEGGIRDLTDEEVGRVTSTFGGKESIDSGIREMTNLLRRSQMRGTEAHDAINGVGLAAESRSARAASSVLSDERDHGQDARKEER